MPGSLTVESKLHINRPRRAARFVPRINRAKAEKLLADFLQCVEEVNAHPDLPHWSLVWLHPDALKTGKTYLLKHRRRPFKARVSVIEHKIDIETLAQQTATHLDMNEIGVVLIEATRALIFDPYQQNRSTGSFILIDPATHATVGAGMIASAVESNRCGMPIPLR